MLIKWLDKNIPWQDQEFEKRKEKTVCVQRYGGFGDMLQMSSILPWLKSQGYRVVVNTTERGYEIIKHDPHVDEVFLQVPDQVPNHELGFYWDKLRKSFDKFVMLSESVEGSLLALPERREAAWHPALRRMIMGTVDYLEATHAIAEVPLPPKVRFYPSKKEAARAKRVRKQISKGGFVILWVLSGSAVHKVFPHMDAVFARLMVGYQDVKIVTVGEPLCKVLEQGWEKEPRVIGKSGDWSIRDTLAFALESDMVVGPETGVLNAVSMVEDIPKILMLSHSGPGNIGKNWKNTVVLEPKNTDCFPCHILHRGFDMCHRDMTTGASVCASNIDVEEMCKHIFFKIEGIEDNEQLPYIMSKTA